MHLVLKSSRAVGKLSLHRESRFIEALIQQAGKRFGIRLYEFSNNGNHLHLLLRAETREGFKSFLRSISGAIARRMTGAKKGKPLSSSFWDNIPFTRIVEWGRDFKNAQSYVIQNLLEALNLIPYQPRKHSAKKLGAI